MSGSRTRISAARTGVKHSEEGRKKASEARKREWASLPEEEKARRIKARAEGLRHYHANKAAKTASPITLHSLV